MTLIPLLLVIYLTTSTQGSLWGSSKEEVEKTLNWAKTTLENLNVQVEEAENKFKATITEEVKRSRREVEAPVEAAIKSLRTDSTLNSNCKIDGLKSLYGMNNVGLEAEGKCWDIVVSSTTLVWDASEFIINTINYMDDLVNGWSYCFQLKNPLTWFTCPFKYVYTVIVDIRAFVSSANTITDKLSSDAEVVESNIKTCFGRSTKNVNETVNHIVQKTKECSVLKK